MGADPDAEYVALATLTGAKLLTRDGRLPRGIARLGIGISPEAI